MSSFEPAVSVVLQHEGEAFTRDPDDPGGATKWGITLATLQRVKSDATVADVAALSKDEACAVYRRLWWDALGLGRIRDQQIATKTLDCCVNMGPQTGIRLLQQAVNCCADPADANAPQLVEDGLLGPKTVAAANACSPREVVLELGFHMLRRYHDLIARNERLEKFRVGWARRAAWPYWARSAVYA